MLTEKFNKIGGTEYRVKSQLQGYMYLINWLISNDFKEKYKDTFDLKIIEKDFKEKLELEGIYKYSKGLIPRFQMITNNIINDIPVIYKKDNNVNNYFLNKEFDLENPKESFLIFLQKYFNSKRNLPFKKMLEFMYKKPFKNDSWRIFLAFSCYEKNDDFENLYDQDLIEIIANKSISLNKDVLSFKKQPSSLKTIKTILKLKENKKIISYEDLNDYDYKKDKYLRKIFFKPSKRFKMSVFINQINKIDYEKFIEELWKIRIKNTLEEYRDLFYRWMFDLDFSDSTSTKNKKFKNHKIILEKNLYLVKKENKKIHYPYQESQVIKFLKMIQEKNFKFKNEDKNLLNIGNSVLAEYFVNLYFCYKWKIKPKDCKKYINTKITNDLYPIFTAPSNVADMSYNVNGNIINIETTIHSTKNAVEKNEIFPCINHLKKDSENKNSATLIFISFFEKEEIQKRFKINLENDLDSKLNPKLFIYTFEHLKNNLLNYFD